MGKGEPPSLLPFAFPVLPPKLCLPIPKEPYCLQNSGWRCSAKAFRVRRAAEGHELQCGLWDLGIFKSQESWDPCGGAGGRLSPALGGQRDV